MKTSSYDRAMELCQEFGVAPLFSFEDWKGYRINSISVDYHVRCLTCGEEFIAHFKRDKMTKCKCTNKNLTRLSKGKVDFESALSKEGLVLLEPYTKASVRGVPVMYLVRCSKCGREYKTYWKSGQIIHCGCESYLRALEVCKEYRVTPVFSRSDWTNAGDRTKYRVKCLKCGDEFLATFHGNKMTVCPCSHRGNLLDKSFRDAMLLCEENGVTPMFSREDWKGYRPTYSDIYIKYWVKCKECGAEFQTTFNRDFMVKCSCKKVWQWRSQREEWVAQWLEGYGIRVIRNCRTLIKAITGQPMEVDLYLPDLNIAFEFNGYQFHCSSLSEYAKPKTYHQRKTDECLSKGVKLYHIWEDTPDYICDSIVLSKVGLSSKVYARECRLTRLPQGWFDSRHVDGDCVSQFRMGLEYKGSIVCGISFRFNNGYAEIARYSNEIGVTVVGGYSKLLHYAIPLLKDNGYKELVSFCNRDLSPDYVKTVYTTLGFEYVGMHLSYKYYNQKKGREVVSRQKMTKSILSDTLDRMGVPHEGMTEEDMAKLLGYSRVYNSGTFKFVKKI